MKWINNVWAFWVAVLLPLLIVWLNEVLQGGIVMYEHIAQARKVMCMVAALLTLTFAGWLCTWLKKGAILPNGYKLWQIYALAVLMSLCGCVAIYLPDGCFLAAFISSMGAICVLWALLGRISWLFWFPFMLVEMVQLGAYFQYGTLVNNVVVLAEIFEASNDEILGYVNISNIVLMGVAMGIAGLFCWLQKRIFQGMARLPLLNLGTLSLLLSACFLHFFHPTKVSIDNLWPTFEFVKFQHNIIEATASNNELISYVAGLPSPAEKPSALPALQQDSGVVLVLHVGESVRADRLGINGYRNAGRDTTPWLSEQMQKGSLINFRDCISSDPLTCFAMITILTDGRRSVRGKKQELKAQAGSVLDLFAANRFSVFSFFGNSAGRMVKSEMITRKLTHCSQGAYWADGLPKSSLPRIQRTLHEQEGKNLVLYINNEGSHMPFRNYDIDEAAFSPSRPSLNNPAAHAQEISNAYDNTIHYTDDFVRKVVEQLHGRPFVYLYVSDHGEYIGHDGCWGRGGVGNYHATTGCRVGMFVITSPEFEALHPHFSYAVKNLREHAAMTVGHEHLYHTLLGLVGLQTPYYDVTLDLCGASPIPYSGPQPGKP